MQAVRTKSNSCFLVTTVSYIFNEVVLQKWVLNGSTFKASCLPNSYLGVFDATTTRFRYERRQEISNFVYKICSPL